LLKPPTGHFVFLTMCYQRVFAHLFTPGLMLAMHDFHA